MQIKTIIELTMGLDSERFRKIFNKICGKKYSDEEEYVDHSLASDGITVTYRNSQYKKKITLAVDSGGVLNGDVSDDNIPGFIKRLDAAIHDYFNSKYELKDFILSKIILSTDIDLGDREKVADYLKVLQRIGKVKGFSEAVNKEYDEDSYFWLKGNSNGVEFIIYDLEAMLKAELKESEVNRRKLKAAIEESEGVLRAEVQLVESKAIRGYTYEAKTSKQLIDLLRKDEKVFMDIFTRIVPFGDFHKKNRAAEIIRREITDDKLRRRMLRLVALIPEKKSLHLAQKALKYRKINDIMDSFAVLDLSPVTISKRHDVKHLQNLYRYL